MTERDPSVSLVTQARKSVTALRDAARQGGMDHRVRDPHVISIHAALDALEREAASRLADGTRGQPLMTYEGHAAGLKGQKIGESMGLSGNLIVESTPPASPAATPADTHEQKKRLKDDVSRVRGWIRNLSVAEPNARLLQGDLSVLAEAADLLKAFGDALAFGDLVLPERRYTETEMQHARKQSHADGYVAGRGAVLSALGLDPERRDDDELNALLASSRVSAATPAPANGELMNRSLRHELLRQEADRQGKSLCMVRSPVGEWQLGYGEAAADMDWLGHGSTPDKAIQNALETDTVLKALAEDIPWDKT